VLSPFPRADVEHVLALVRRELERLGWVDGRNVVLLEPRLAEGRNERLPALAAELVAQNPEVILVQSAPATRALMQATQSIPIVMVGVGNPVEYGIVPQLARPGGNVTGMAFLADEQLLKLLQLLKQAAPRIRSVAVFANPTNEAAAPMIKTMQDAAASHGMRALTAEVSGPGDFESAFATIRRENAEAILIPPEPLIRSRRDAIGEFALRYGLPLGVIGTSRQLPAGGLIAYAPTTDQFAIACARYVDKLLRGAKAGELPVEQPTRFELVVNLKTAKAIGLTLPPSLLTSADEVIQ
jgi:putative ABC transport system substrate-binding protein